VNEDDVLREIGLLRCRIEALENAIISSSVKKDKHDKRTHKEKIVEVLRATPQPLRASEIARLALISVGAVRTAVYEDKEQRVFTRVADGPKHTRWKLTGNRA
jgi:hypothetical protein